MMNFKQSIKNGNICLGIEFGSTRIKAALIDENNKLIEMGSFT
jgi:sugar (pentulose or hexulose) kinase